MEMGILHRFIFFCAPIYMFVIIGPGCTETSGENKFCVLSTGNQDIKVYREENEVKSSKGYIIRFSICGRIKHNGCDHSAACIEENGSYINAGRYFVLGDNEKEGTKALIKSVGGSKCHSNPNKNVSLTVIVSCSDNLPIHPVSLESTDDCAYKVGIMSFDCQPKCTKRVDGYFIDLRPLKRHMSTEFNNSTFMVSICAANNHCGSGVSACEIVSGGHNVLSLQTEETVNYDRNRNSVSIKGKSAQAGPGLRRFELHIECNWEADHSNLTYISKKIQGQRYDFRIQSRLGCIKLQPQCLVDESLSHTRYNLSGLHKINGNWQVTAVPNGTIFLNICGELKITTSKPNPCTDYQSQVCESINNNKYISWGSSTTFGIRDEFVEGVISDGSLCENDPTINYKTIINFHCYHMETGPVFLKKEPCTLHLEWKSPAACPYYHSSGFGHCTINDGFGFKNLNGISPHDKTYSISGKTLSYNICGSLTSPCGSYNGNVSVCLSDNDESLVIGWMNQHIVSENQTLMLNLEGEKCNTYMNAKVTVQFICNRTTHRYDEITVVHDGCVYDIKIYSPLACVNQATYKAECQICHENHCYDLNTLMSNTSNYIVKSTELPNLDFIVNMCGSVLNEYDLNCHDSIVCIRNQSEFNIKHKYHSLGSMRKVKAVNNSLMIETITGSVCGSNNYYRSVFLFHCTELKDKLYLSKHDQCTYHFIWETKQACPKCSFRQPSGKSVDLDALQKKIFRINVAKDNYYEFNICENRYSRSISGKRKSFDLTKKVEERMLIFAIGNQCSSNNYLTTIRLHLMCEPLSNNDHFEQIGTKNCVAELILRTKIVCSNEESYAVMNTSDLYEAKLSHDVEKTTTTTVKTAYKLVPDPVLVTPMPLFCSIEDHNSGHILSLLSLNSSNIVIEDRSYTVTWKANPNGSNICNNVTLDKMEGSVDMYFNTNLTCASGRYEMKVTLKCDNSGVIHSHKVNTCLVSMTYLFSDLCEIMEEPPHSVSGSDLVGIIVGIIISLIGAVGFFIYRKRIRRCKSTNSEYTGLTYYKRGSD